MGMGRLLYKLLNLSKNDELTKGLQKLSSLYDLGLYIDYIDIVSLVNYYIKKRTDNEQWEIDILELIEEYRPVIDLCRILRKRYILNYV